MREPIGEGQISQAEFEAMMRRWLLKVSARYVPVAVIGLGIALIIAFVPTTQPNGAAGGLQAGAPGAQGGGTTGSSAGGAANPAATPGQGGAPSGGGSATPGTAGTTQAAASPAASSGITPPATSGVARTGVTCGPGVRQFTWSKYAPNCVPAYHGNNGGATAPGVTPTTITLTYRLANSAQQSAINALAGAANVNQDDYVSDLKAYIAYLNKQFELYGRQVVLKTYQGQGDYIEEDQGQDLAATQSDAVTAHDMGAFGDVTFSLEASQPYEEDLAAEHVIGFSSVGLSQQWFEQHAPYEYSVQGPTGTNGVTSAAAVVCRRLAGMPAAFSSDTIYQHTNRKFGIIFPQTPVYASEVDLWKQQMSTGCGVQVASNDTIGYTINIAQYEQEATTAMAELKSDGVTTILCACDPIVPIFLTNAAAQQQYFPEWFATYFGDPIARNYNQTEWQNTIVNGIQFPSIPTTEAFKTYQLAYPGQHPAEWSPGSPPYFYVPYYTLLQIFDALQAAGPDLTPSSFEGGMFSLPSSAPGDVVGAQWNFGQRVFDPVTSYSLAKWNPNTVSAFDNTKGAYTWCNGGQTYLVTDPSALGGPREQLQCG
ncbi:MAG TPA: hypothetical protein VFV02_02240 [Acidimicrobiales bacterium]|nr:hypothetical protein [Acidimicrobiales bacterium]